MPWVSVWDVSYAVCFKTTWAERVMAGTQLARKFTEVDPSDLTELLDRWHGWFALVLSRR